MEDILTREVFSQLSPTAQTAVLQPVTQFFAVVTKNQLMVACALSFTIYDWISLLGRERRYIWQARWSVMKGLYVWVRYASFPLLSYYMALWYGNWTPERCQKAYWVLSVLPAFWIPPAHLIMMLRTYALWGSPRWFLVLSAVLLCTEVAVTLQTTITDHMVPFLLSEGPCLPSSDDMSSLIYYGLALLTDLITTSLTIYKIMTLDTHRGNMQSEAGPTRVNSVVDVMLAHQLQYYAFITSLNIMQIIWNGSKLGSDDASFLGVLALIPTGLFSLRLALDLKVAADVENVHRAGPGDSDFSDVSFVRKPKASIRSTSAIPLQIFR